MEKEVKPILLTASSVSKYNPFLSIGKKSWSMYFLKFSETKTGETLTAKNLYLVNEQASKEEGKWVYHTPTNQVLKYKFTTALTLNDYLPVVATTDPKLIADGVPGVSDKFLQQFVEVQGKGKIMMEMTTAEYQFRQWDNYQNTTHDPEKGLISAGKTPPEFRDIPKLDQSGNAILSFIPEGGSFESLCGCGKSSYMHCDGSGRNCKNDEVFNFVKFDPNHLPEVDPIEKNATSYTINNTPEYITKDDFLTIKEAFKAGVTWAIEHYKIDTDGK